MYKAKSAQQRERVSCDLFLCSINTLFIIAITTSQCVYVIGLNIVLFILIFLQNEYLANEKGIPQQCHSMKWLLDKKLIQTKASSSLSEQKFVMTK